MLSIFGEQELQPLDTPRKLTESRIVLNTESTFACWPFLSLLLKSSDHIISEGADNSVFYELGFFSMVSYLF